MGLRNLVVLLTCTLAVVKAVTNPLTAAVSCTGSNPEFPEVVTDTSNQYLSFVLSLQSQETDPNLFRNLQIRPDPTTPGAFLVVIDAASPVLALTLSNNTLLSETRNRPTPKGQVGGLRNSTAYNSATQNVREFVFRNLTGASASFVESYNKWQLYGGISDASYSLRSSVSQLDEHEFLACKRGTPNDIYYQILYTSFPSGGGTSIPNCTAVVNFEVSCNSVPGPPDAAYEALLQPGINQICNQYCTNNN